MGPDIDRNAVLFDFDAVKTAGMLAQLGQSKSSALGGFRLYGSMWSPAPWLKLTSGNRYSGGAFPLPPANAPWPFVWGGNFAGGILDTSDNPLAAFDDSALGGSGPTSALTQFARSLAAYLRGFQNKYGVRFYAISIQNEINFEEFYNSCSYPLSLPYIKALKAARSELDKYADLKDILMAGPEDLMGGDAWGMWQYGGGSDITHKNLQYLLNIAADPVAAKHFFRFIRPGAIAVSTSVSGASSLYASAYLHEANGTVTMVLINAEPGTKIVTVTVPAIPKGILAFDAYSSSDGTYGKSSTIAATGDKASVPVPG